MRGPDLLWGGDVKFFHVPSNKFDGVIGGPPCKKFSSMTNIVRARYGESAVAENLIPEFERIVCQARPRWFLMENTRHAPLPQAHGYAISSLLLNNRSFGSPQNRVRRFSFGVCGDVSVSLLRHLHPLALEHARFERAVLAGHSGSGTGLKYSGRRKDGTHYEIKHKARMSIERASARSLKDDLELQGLPGDMLDHAPFTVKGKRQVVGNGVPLPMGRSIALAVRKQLELL